VLLDARDTEADSPCTAKTPVCTLHLTQRMLKMRVDQASALAWVAVAMAYWCLSTWYSWYVLAPVDRGVQLQHHVTLVVLDEK
jgi:hypothetical protein